MIYKKLNSVMLCVFWSTVMSLSFTTVVAQDVHTGTIEGLDQDNGSIVISGRTLPYSDAITEVFLNEQKVGSHKIQMGMIVRYVLNASGQLLRIELLGPGEKLRELETN